MLASIIAAFQSFWDAFLDAIQTAWDWVKSGYAWIVGLIVALLATIDSVVTQAFDMLNSLVEAVASIVMPDGSVTLASTDWLNTANTFFPVSEGFVILIAMSALWVACLIYRTIKSWIPTVS